MKPFVQEYWNIRGLVVKIEEEEITRCYQPSRQALGNTLQVCTQQLIQVRKYRNLGFLVSKRVLQRHKLTDTHSALLSVRLFLGSSCLREMLDFRNLLLYKFYNFSFHSQCL